MRPLSITKLFQKKELLICLFSCFLFSFGAIAQKTITGTVKDETGTAISGVSIVVKNDIAVGTTTNASGKFSLNLAAGITELTISSIGYLGQDVNVSDRTILDIVLVIDKLNLNEVVVMGYSSQQKKDITGSVAVVDMKSIKSIPAGSAMQALQGMASGVNVISSGLPGAESKILIRGVTSFGNTQPLVMIDGVQGSLNNISTEDIESIQVLKDAGAASIYGVRGANGVIVVTTKKGKSGKPVITYHGYVANQTPPSGNPLNVLNSNEFATMFKVAFPNTGLFANGIPDYTYGGAGGRGVAAEGDPKIDPSNYVLDPANPTNNYLIQKLNKTGTDWFHEFFKPAIMTSHTISASGGTDKSNYLFSMGYLNQEGTAIETFQKRYTARINTQFKLPGNIRVGENAAIIYGNNAGFDSRTSDFNTMYMLYFMLPVIPVYDIKGNFGNTFAGPTEMGNFANPIALQKKMVNDRHHNWNIVGNVYAEVDFLSHFTARTSFGGTISNRYDQVFSPNQYWAPNEYAIPNSYSESAGYSSNYIWTNTLNYSNRFGKHDVKVLAGSEAVKDFGRSVGGSSRRFFATDYDYLVLGNGTQNVTNFSSAYSASLASLFGRLDYSFDDKYLLGVTVRRDGSSRFGPQKRYGTFPSYSAGWRVSEEKFMQNLAWLNDLKIRGSYGILGSQNNISATNSFSLYGSYFGSGYDINGSGNSVQQGFYQTSIGNPLTGWEENVVSNIGFDATLFNKLSLSLEYYKKSINGLLFAKPLPSTAGGASRPFVNVGDIQNTGIDITTKYFGSLANNQLKFSITANVTTYKNIVKKIPAPGYFNTVSQQQIGNLVRNQEGQAVSAFYGYEVIGLFSSDADVSSSPAQPAGAPGRLKFRDVNGDKKITTDDRTFLGSPNPDFTYGLSLNLEYKGFDFSTFFYGSQGAEIVNSLKALSHFWTSYRTNKSRDLLNAWTPSNTNTTIPIIEATSNFSTNNMSSFFVEDGSYLRLKSLILGYTIDPGKLKKIGIARLRPYLQATNLFTITNYSGLDPELGGPTANFGIDWGNYPGNFKNFVFGLDISF